MAKFKDRHGRDWSIDIDVGQIKTVRDSVTIDGAPLVLYDLIDEKFTKLRRLMNDHLKLVDIVFVLCAEQAKREAIDADQFARALSGQALSDMAEAFVQALIDFFPDRRTAAVLQKIFLKAEAVAAATCEKAELELAALDPKLLAEKLRKQFGNSPASLASTQPDEPSPSSS